MGDRAQLHIISNEARITLYTHWHGYEVPKIAERAIETLYTTGRVDDKSYAVAIIVKEFIRSCGGLDTPLEVGIGTRYGDHDNEYDFVLVIDLDKQTVEYQHTDDPGGTWVPMAKFCEENMPVEWQ